MQSRVVLSALAVLLMLAAAMLVRSEPGPEPSAAATKTPTPAAGELTALTDVAAVSPSPGLLTVSWGGAEHATSFVLFLYADAFSGEARLGGGVSSHTFTSLPAGVYSVAVVAQQHADGGGEYRDVSAEADAVTVTAGYTLTTSAGPNGAVDPAPGIHGQSRGSSATVTATPAEHYRIEAWGGDCAATPAISATCTLTMDADRGASVTFTAITYTLTTSAGPNGTIDPAPGAHVRNAGTAVAVTATPAEGYRVEAWGGDCANTPATSATCDLTMGGDRTASVTFSLIPTTCSSGVAVPNPAANPGLVADCETLLGLRDALRGTATLNWSAERAMAQWTGVITGGTPARVTGVVLVGKRLAGVIPAELGELGELRQLKLHQNRLTGALPVELGGLSRLGTLVLSSNRLTGVIPPEFGNLRSLHSLGLDNNNLTGSLPPGLARLPLSWLWVKNNDFTGCVPPALRGVHTNDLAGLRLPDCGACELGTAVPDPAANPGLVRDCKALLTAKDALSARRAALLDWGGTAAIAEWDGVTVSGEPPRVTALTLARTGGRESGGRISPALGNLDALTSLTMSWNKLRGPIPAELGRLAKLETLSLYRNTLTGAIPVGLGQLAELRTLSLGANFLTGSIPAELGSLAKLEDLALGENRLTGCVPYALLTVATHDLATLGLKRCGDLPLTTLTYDTYDTTGAVTEPGSYAFKSETGVIATYEGLRDGSATNLLIQTSDATGTSQAGVLDIVETGDLFEWKQADDCFIRYRVMDEPLASEATVSREFGVRAETYAFQSCQTGSLPTDDGGGSGTASAAATATFTLATELPLEHLGGTNLTGFAVVHGGLQRTPSNEVVATMTLRRPSWSDPVRLLEVETTDLVVARDIPYWREPAAGALPRGWTFGFALGGEANGYNSSGFVAVWETASGYEGFKIEGIYVPRGSRTAAAPSSWTTSDGKLHVQEPLVIAGRPAWVRYSPLGAQHNAASAAAVDVYDAETETVYHVLGATGSLRGGPAAAEKLIAITCSLFLSAGECSATP